MTDGSAMTDSDAETGDGTATTHPAHEETGELKGTGYELFVLLVSLLSIANTLIVLLPVSAPIQQVAVLVDLMIVPVFLVDFLYRLRTAQSRRVYLVRHFGWADMLRSSRCSGCSGRSALCATSRCCGDGGRSRWPSTWTGDAPRPRS